MSCGGPKRSPHTSFIVQIKFSFWSFEISDYSEKPEINYRSNRRFICLILDNTGHCIDYPVESCKSTIFRFGSVLPNLKN